MLFKKNCFNVHDNTRNKKRQEKNKNKMTLKKRSFSKLKNRLNSEIKKNDNGKFDLLNNETKKELLNMFSTLSNRRSMLSHRLGLSYKNDARDTYKALGYPQEITFDHYWAFYTREHIAKRIVDAPVNACWQKPPEIFEENTEDGKNTTFEKAWIDLVKEKKIWHFLSRIDRLSGIGQYGILLLGFDGDGGLEEEVVSANKLLYVRPYKQDKVKIKTYVEDVKNERYGLPETYQISITTSNEREVSAIVHWSRIIHVADELLEDDIYGTPRMQNVYNLIAGLHLVSGGSGEMFWRGAFPGLAFILDKEAELDPAQGVDDLNTEINNYIHDLNRHMKLQGMKVENLSPQVADPSNHIEMYITLIAGAREIPKRILVGAERGELGGDRDETAWCKKIRERQINYCDPGIVRPLIDRLITLRVLPEPKEGYVVDFPDITVPTLEEEARVMKTRTEALAAYGNSLGAQEVVPPDVFLKEVMGFDDGMIEKINNVMVERVEDDLEEGD
ncbi:MAG: DUF1073 domain-containing protein [Gammaproteobacteria bacterium]|nr:DUF1073 domain-containing protein [Gammaproteobacteria bacterium]